MADPYDPVISIDHQQRALSAADNNLIALNHELSITLAGTERYAMLQLKIARAISADAGTQNLIASDLAIAHP